MRTLKKVLALTVALATLFSLTAFAAFTDEDQINESLIADINLMGALNVMTGDTEGTFRPNDTISRAEAAKMIYVIRNGGDDDKAIGWVENGLNAFTDVLPGIWARTGPGTSSKTHSWPTSLTITALPMALPLLVSGPRSCSPTPS